jgi:hypothetical protein
MIECIFTIDYEISGNGEGSLRTLVYEPAERLRTIFRKWNAKFVPFVEVAELERIESEGTDPAIDLVKQQIRYFYDNDFEIGLHLHPQWYNARYENGRWFLDYSEYNLCALHRERIVEIVDRSLAYLRNTIGVAGFTPFSFRAGNWLFKPTRPAADVLAERGIKVDSSVFKGGVRHQHQLDYRRALKNGSYWKFRDHADVPDPEGVLLELPIYTQMVPLWKMLDAKRVNPQHIGIGGAKKLHRLLDFLRFWHPLKLDFCSLTIDELTRMMERIIGEDKQDPTSFRPVVAIGHTKELVDFETVDSFLSHLHRKGIPVSTFKEVYEKCQ